MSHCKQLELVRIRHSMQVLHSPVQSVQTPEYIILLK